MSKPFEIDEDRVRRLGFEEVVYGAAKSLSLLVKLLEEYQSKDQNVLVTKLQEEKGLGLLQRFEGAFFEAESRHFHPLPY